MKILTVANHIAILEELEKELSAVSPGYIYEIHIGFVVSRC